MVKEESVPKNSKILGTLKTEITGIVDQISEHFDDMVDGVKEEEN